MKAKTRVVIYCLVSFALAVMLWLIVSDRSSPVTAETRAMPAPVSEIQPKDARAVGDAAAPTAPHARVELGAPNSIDPLSVLLEHWPTTDVGTIDFENVKFTGWPDLHETQEYLSDERINPGKIAGSAVARAALDEQLRTRAARVDQVVSEFSRASRELVLSKLAMGQAELLTGHASRKAEGALLISHTTAEGLTYDVQAYPGQSVALDLAYRELQLQGAAALEDVKSWIAAQTE